MSANTNTTPAGTVVSIPVIDITTLPTDLKTIKDEAGVKDLPMRVRGPFCQAIKAERSGDPVKAAQKLEEAVAAEIAD